MLGALLGSVVPQIVQIPTPEDCSGSRALGVFTSAENLLVDILAVGDGPSTLGFAELPKMAQQTDVIAQVSITPVGSADPVYLLRTMPFDIEPGVEVALDEDRSRLGSSPLRGLALLQFLETKFSFLGAAQLLENPALGAINGELQMLIVYELFVGGTPITVQKYAATMNVNVINRSIGAPALGYTMGLSSIKLGNLFIPNFTFPVGTKKAKGRVQLAGGGYSIDMPLEFLVDPYLNAYGTSTYPGNFQGTHSLAMNFTGSVTPEAALGQFPVFNASLTGRATGFNTDSLLVPLYVPNVSGTVMLTPV